MATFCMAMSIKYLEWFIKTYPNSKIIGFKGKELSDKDSLKYCDELRKVGYKAVPCSHSNKLGYCMGIKEEGVKTK